MPLLWFLLLTQDSEVISTACQLDGFAAGSREYHLPAQLSHTSTSTSVTETTISTTFTSYSMAQDSSNKSTLAAPILVKPLTK